MEGTHLLSRNCEEEAKKFRLGVLPHLALQTVPATVHGRCVVKMGKALNVCVRDVIRKRYIHSMGQVVVAGTH